MPAKTTRPVTVQSSSEEKSSIRQERGGGYAAALSNAPSRPQLSRHILQLQKTIGNRALTRLLPLMVQRTLDVNGAAVDPEEIKTKIAGRDNLKTWVQSLQDAVDALNLANTSATTAQELANSIVTQAKLAKGGPVAKTALKQIIEAYLKAQERRDETARKLQAKPPKILTGCSAERHLFPGATQSAIKEGRTTIIKAEKYTADLVKINKALEGTQNGLGDDSLKIPYAVAFVGIGYELTIDGTNYRWQPDHGMYPIGGTDTKSDAAAATVIKTNNWV